jgi:phosphoglycolate phosphatase-like HAD superfamily hydrolase
MVAREVTYCRVAIPSIELAPSFRARPIRHVLMDWDGTTSLTRAGWAGLMADVYVENLPSLRDETDSAKREFSSLEIMRLNGRPSIHQLAHLADLIRERGGQPADVADYQFEFQRRLTALADARLGQVRSGKSRPDDLLVPGIRALFESLRGRGVTLTLATGTPLEQVEQEADVLDVSRYFHALHGPDDVHDRSFSKRAIIDRILETHRLEGTALLAFGDGPVELAETKAVGGIAVAVACNEEDHRSGEVDPAKRKSLLAAGADAVVADFRAAAEILATFFAS